MSEEEIKTYEPMPKTLAESLEALEKDAKWAEKTFGKDLLFFYKAAKKHEVEMGEKQSEEERKANALKNF